MARGISLPVRQLWLAGLVAGLAAAAASAAVYWIARAAGVPMELTEVFEDEFARVSVLDMVWGALLDGAVVGTAIAAACRRWSRRPQRWFLTLAGGGLLASFALPVASDASTATKVVLSVSHVVIAAIIVPALASALPRRSPQPASRHGNG